MIVSCNSLQNGLMYFIYLFIFLYVCDDVHQDETQIN